MKELKNKTILLTISLLALILIILSLFIKTNKTCNFPCLFLAQAEWSIHMDDPEKIYMEFTRNDENIIDQYTCFQFNRPDLVHFRLSPQVTMGSHLKAGQVVAHIKSEEDDYRLTTLKAEIEKTRAELKMLSAGEKTELQQEALQELEYVKAQVETFKPQLERKKEMYESNLISYEELEIAESTFKLYKINVGLQEAKLKAVQSGEKTEYLDYVKTALSGIENQYYALKQKNHAKKVCTPVSGIVSDSNGPGTLCQINKMDTLVIKIPVTEAYLGLLQTGQKVHITLPHHKYKTIESSIDEIGNQAHFINGQPMFYLVCSIHNPEYELKPGSTGIAKIHCGHLTLYERFVEQWNNYKLRKQLI